MGDDYIGLSEEEIAALKEDKDSGDELDGEGEKDAGAKDAGNDGGEGDAANMDKVHQQGDAGDGAASGEKGDAEGDAKGELEYPSGKGKASTEGDASGADEKNAVPEQEPFVPQFQGAEDGELEGLKTALDEAKTKFDEGEIDFATFSEAKDSYHEAKWKADFAADANTNLVNERWKWEQDRFLSENAMFRDNLSLNAAFTNAVNKIIASKDGASLSDRGVLDQAKDRVEADMNLLYKDKGPASAAGSGKAKAIQGAKQGAGDRTKIPADFRDAPSAGSNNEANQFAFLDKLSGEKYQSAIDKMSPAQLEAYENS